MKMEQTECSETLAYTIQSPGNYPGENIQNVKHTYCSVKALLFATRWFRPCIEDSPKNKVKNSNTLP